MPHTLLITPPLSQLNTPYPATAHLTGFLRSRGVLAHQCDLGIDLALALYSRDGLQRVFEHITQLPEAPADDISRMQALRPDYLATIDPVVAFLQNRDDTLAQRICSPDYLPRANRFENLQDLDWAFGTLGLRDRARMLATLYLQDLADLVRRTVTPHFELCRYAESLSISATSFDALSDALQEPPTLLDDMMLESLARHLGARPVSLIGLSVPFPGNLYGALRCGQFIKRHHPDAQIVLGGGYANTELRQLSDPRIFDFLDYICLDDGEAPLLALHAAIERGGDLTGLVRTYWRDGQTVRYVQGSDEVISHGDIAVPTYDGLPLADYLSITDVPNPMHRLWNDGRWNKLFLAHGCYWKRCSFCDINLDYIRRYDETSATALVDRIDAIIDETGQTGFHFVDEAASPQLLQALALELLRRRRTITWWTNIRFEKGFTADLCRLLAASGCVAVSGGLEVASDRLLSLMKKGTTVKRVASSAAHFTDAGILVHAYLMYGFPTQTERETVDALEVVRQLFEAGVVQSGFWHRFALTAHSGIADDPAKFGIEIRQAEHGGFAHNEIAYREPGACDHARLGKALAHALHNYMHGAGISQPVHEWFDFTVPTTSVDPQLIANAITDSHDERRRRHSVSPAWIGPKPLYEFAKIAPKSTKPVIPANAGIQENSSGPPLLGPRLHEDDTELSVPTPSNTATPDGDATLTLHGRADTVALEIDAELARWLAQWLDDRMPGHGAPQTLAQTATQYEAEFGGSFEELESSDLWDLLRQEGLLLLPTRTSAGPDPSAP